MACINADGTLAPSAKAILKVLSQPCTLPEVAKKTGLPLYRIRMNIRELSEAGLLATTGEQYQTTAKGSTMLD